MFARSLRATVSISHTSRPWSSTRTTGAQPTAIRQRSKGRQW
jgi:hypothetical protein